VVGLSPADFEHLGPAAVQIANAEGLAGHAGAVQVRLDSLNSTGDRIPESQPA
jgi:histidinol dehydrogenase